MCAVRSAPDWELRTLPAPLAHNRPYRRTWRAPRHTTTQRMSIGSRCFVPSIAPCQVIVATPCNSNRSQRLVIFGDDWGRHPSSIQHLAKQLLPIYDIHWVHTIGTRRPQLRLSDLRRGVEKAREWSFGLGKPRSGHDGVGQRCPNIHAPIMWPTFATRASRRLNSKLIRLHLQRILASSHKDAAALIAATPILGDVVRRTRHLPWTYYCADNYAEWPGADRDSILSLEKETVRWASRIIVTSESLRRRFASMGRRATIIDHGVDVQAWRCDPEPSGMSRPRAVFWGSVDGRLDISACHALAQVCDVHLYGPQHGAAPDLDGHPGVRLHPALPFEALPQLGARADLLVMPYRDMPATRAMQPLKLKEYLATYKPVLAAPLPAVSPWAETLDVCRTPAEFRRAALMRAGRPIPQKQVQARSALARETWAAKARELQLALIH